MEKLFIFQQFFILLALHVFSILPFSSAYTPPAEYFINCGSNSNFNGNGGRNFVGDRSSGVSFSVGQGSTVQDSSPSAGVSPLYQSARTYGEPSFYEFMIKESGTYFVRLHFFVSSSSNNLASAMFSVIASEFSLLSNFSVKNNPGLPVVKEFLVNVRAGRFRIHFVPTEGSNLAFINAIEVFLTPEKFINDTAPLITPADGRRNSFNNLQSQVLHTLYRINVGGPILTPETDTLWRNWIPDDSFLFNPRAARNSSFFGDPKYHLGTATEYIAPSPVYRTAKEFNIEAIQQLNLSSITWSFNVGKSSRHFVRLHFCDITNVFDSIVFNLSINNKFVERISSYEQVVQLETPFYFDFVVDSDESGIMNISIGLRSNSLNQNAFLNGIEIMEFMKKSDIVLPPEKPKSKRSNLFAIVGSVVGGAFVIILIVAVLVVLKCRKAKPAQSSTWPLPLPLYGRGSSYNRMSWTTANMSPFNLNLALRISHYEIEQSTKNFDSNLLIGEGGFGKVYEGLFRGKKVAVKRSEPGHGQGLLEFQTEIVVLSQIRHRHLVSLIGYCDERSEMILVYEFMERGTLRDNLYYSTPYPEESHGARSEISWKQRLEICIGAAKGLNYLHTGAAGRIIHRDIKPAVITSNRREEVNLAEWGMLWLRNGQLEKIIDPMLVDTINPNSLRKFAETAEKCLRPSGRERPTMKDVLWDLEYALQLQLTPMNSGPYEDSTTIASLEFSMPVLHRLPSNNFLAVGEEDATVLLGDGSGVTASQVFSTLRVGEAR
ncbi:hypothetical protein GQ457_02G015010 [Hibiscus cannabinus]